MEARKEAFISVLDMWTSHIEESMGDYSLKDWKQLYRMKKVKDKLRRGKYIKQELMRPIACHLENNMRDILLDSVADMAIAWRRKDRKEFLDQVESVVWYSDRIEACAHYARSWMGFAD